jgi:hypothetical protein
MPQAKAIRTSPQKQVFADPKFHPQAIDQGMSTPMKLKGKNTY